MASFSHRGCAWRSDGDLPGVSERAVQLSRRIHAAGNVVLTESLIYPGVKASAAYTGVRLGGVPMDDKPTLQIGLQRLRREIHRKIEMGSWRVRAGQSIPRY